MSVRIEFDDWFPPNGRDVLAPIPRFRLRDASGKSLGIVIILVAGTGSHALHSTLGLEETPGSLAAPIARAVLRHGVRQIERAIQQGILPQEDASTAYEVKVSSDEIDVLVTLAGNKECRYQSNDGLDLFCLAASPADKTARWVIGGRAAGPTSIPLCNDCALPDTDYVCSNFSHADVVGVTAGSATSPARRVLMAALCQRGRAEIANTPHECRPAGNECWERDIDTRVLPAVDLNPPLHLLEAVDSLDTAWRLLQGREHHLVHLASTAGVAALMLPCSSREEFESRVSDLADLFKRIEVPDTLLAPEAAGIDKGHTLQRMKAALITKTQGADTDEVESAVRVLQTINGVRVGQQHSGAIKEAKQSLELLGIRYPVDDWDGAWSRVRNAAADAFLRLAHVVRRLEASQQASS